MDWLEQNLDAYRIIAEILTDLREVFRAALEATHGATWYKEGLPEGLLEKLIETKEKEKAIDWYESEYQQVMNYAVFPDLLKILEHNSDLFPDIVRLAPTTALLHARFLELEVMRSKLGRARPISETELAFLGTFHLRFRKAIDEIRSQGFPAQPGGADAAAASSTAEEPQPQAAEPLKEAAVEVDAPETGEQETATVVDGPPRRAAQTPAEASSTAATETASPGPDSPMADEDTAVRDESVEQAEQVQPEPEEPSIETALEQGDDRAILRALYQEVTTTAESIWAKDVLPTTSVWNRVSTSDWYEESFTPLGLKPVSDFYEVISKVDGKMREGASKEELQEYLKESNFARILLALRDMFQRNEI